MTQTCGAVGCHGSHRLTQRGQCRLLAGVFGESISQHLQSDQQSDEHVIASRGQTRSQPQERAYVDADPRMVVPQQSAEQSIQSSEQRSTPGVCWAACTALQSARGGSEAQPIGIFSQGIKVDRTCILSRAGNPRSPLVQSQLYGSDGQHVLPQEGSHARSYARPAERFSRHAHCRRSVIGSSANRQNVAILGLEMPGAIEDGAHSELALHRQRRLVIGENTECIHHRHVAEANRSS
jgi:hypothetical protein